MTSSHAPGYRPGLCLTLALLPSTVRHASADVTLSLRQGYCYFKLLTTAPAPSRGFCSWPLQLRRPGALAAPSLLLLPCDRPRPALIGRTSGWPLRLGSPGAPGRQASAGRQLPSFVQTPLNCGGRPRRRRHAGGSPGDSGLFHCAACVRATPELLIVFVFRPRPALIGSTNGLPLRLGLPWAPGRQACAGRQLPSFAQTPLNCGGRPRRRRHAGGSPGDSGLFHCAACVRATPELLSVFVFRPRPALIGRANGWPLRLGLPWAPGRQASAGSHLPSSAQTALTAVTDPAAGVTPEAPPAIVASSTAPPACGLRPNY